MTLKLLATTIETVLNQALRLDSSSLSNLEPLAGKIIRVDLIGMNVSLALFPDRQGILVMTDYQGEVDAHISGPPFSLLRLLMQPTATLANSGITVQGRISVAQQLFTILKQLHIDWEEQLARYMGDVPAHQLGRLFQHGQDYAQKLMNHLQHQVTDYLQEEVRHFPARAEVEAWLNDIDTLRNDLARLEQRVLRLHKLLSTA